MFRVTLDGITINFNDTIFDINLESSASMYSQGLHSKPT